MTEQTLCTLSSQISALSLKLDGKLGKLEELERLTEMTKLFSADREIRERNEQYLKELRESDAKIASLEKELSETKSALINSGTALANALERVGSLEKQVGECNVKLAKSHTIGENGEKDLLNTLQELQKSYGDGFNYRYTGNVKHSGDVIIDVRVRKVIPGGESVFSILLDRKNYRDDKKPNTVQTAHVQTGVMDANSNRCNAVVVVYNSISETYGGICEYEAISPRYTAPMDPTFVKACSLKALPVAISKLMFDFNPISGEKLDAVNMRESLKYAELAYLNLFDIVSPVLNSIDITKINQAANDASLAIIEAKRYLSVLPSKHGAELLKLLSRFPEKSAGNRGGKAIQVTGSRVKLQTEEDEVRKRALLEVEKEVGAGEGEASSSKHIRVGVGGEK
jgi:hypothetical protein